jgi:hypothetical protein
MDISELKRSSHMNDVNSVKEEVVLAVKGRVDVEGHLGGDHSWHGHENLEPQGEVLP